MSLPLLFSEPAGGLLIGGVFGWFLEQGGMGNAMRIAGQFYFRDLAVLKVMFSAIITTAIGLFWFARLGLLDYDSLIFLETYIWPQAIGGLIFGAGFVLGGLCPGTSCVALASGKLDGGALLLGLLAGIVLFNESFFLFETLYYSGARGELLLPQMFGQSHAKILLVLVALGLGAFAAAEQLERRTTAS